VIVEQLPTRRAVLVGGAALACVAGASPPDDTALFTVLDAVGPFTADAFHPGRALAAAKALLALAPSDRALALRRYVAARPAPPEGLFAVVRMLVEVPPPSQPATPFPGVLQPGFLRPPALGAPLPTQPADLPAYPRWPLVVVDDVPLVVVQGYMLGGSPEPLSMHLDGLAGATWRTAPLAPTSAGSVRMTLIHWGAWSHDLPLSAQLEEQLRRYESGAR
jgi:hypothetical protein